MTEKFSLLVQDLSFIQSTNSDSQTSNRPYTGELNGRHGYVPCNMVSEMQYDPETGLATNSLRQQQMSTFSAQDPWSHLPVRRMIALYDYDPLELSPNPDAEMELAFNTGDIIYVSFPKSLKIGF